MAIGTVWRDPLLTCYLLFVATIPIARPALISVGGKPVQLADVFLVAAYVIWGARVLAGTYRLRFDRLTIASVVFLGTLLLSLVVTHTLGGARLLKLAAFATFVLLPVLSKDVLGDEARLQLALKAWFVGAAIATLTGIVGIVAFYADRPTGLAMMCGYGGLPAGDYPRLCAPFRNQNMFCNYLTIVAGLLLACGSGFFRRAVLWSFVAAVTLVAIFTLSAGMGGFALAAAIALIGGRVLASKPWRLRDRALAVVALLAAAFFALSMLATLQPEGRGNVSLGSRDLLFPDGPRPSIWKGVVPAIRRYPVTGMGYGALVSETDDPRAFTQPDLIPALPRTTAPQRMEAHDIWLNVLGQAGVIGLAAFLWLVLEILRHFRGLRRPGDGPLFALPAGLLGAVMGAFLFHGVFGALEEARHIWALFGLLTGCATVAARARGASDPQRAIER
jgi:O-antigen ligase